MIAGELTLAVADTCLNSTGRLHASCFMLPWLGLSSGSGDAKIDQILSVICARLRYAVTRSWSALGLATEAPASSPTAQRPPNLPNGWIYAATQLAKCRGDSCLLRNAVKFALFGRPGVTTTTIAAAQQSSKN